MKIGRNGGKVPRGALLLLLFGLVPDELPAGVSIAVVPPYVEKATRAGSHFSDTLSYTNQGSAPVVVEVDLADFGVAENGAVAEAPPGTEAASLVPHLRISPTRIRVAPNQQVFFRYSVEAPGQFDQLRSMIFLSSYPEAPAGANHVRVVPRMGIPVYVENVKSEPARLEIEEVGWDRPSETPERLRVRLRVANLGQRNIRPDGLVHVRSADGRFRTTFEFNAGREPVLPGQKRRWEQLFGPVPDGALEVELRLTTSERTAYEARANVGSATP